MSGEIAAEKKLFEMLYSRFDSDKIDAELKKLEEKITLLNRQLATTHVRLTVALHIKKSRERYAGGCGQ